MLLNWEHLERLSASCLATLRGNSDTKWLHFIYFKSIQIHRSRKNHSRKEMIFKRKNEVNKTIFWCRPTSLKWSCRFYCWTLEGSHLTQRTVSAPRGGSVSHQKNCNVLCIRKLCCSVADDVDTTFPIIQRGQSVWASTHTFMDSKLSSVFPSRFCWNGKGEDKEVGSDGRLRNDSVSTFLLQRNFSLQRTLVVSAQQTEKIWLGCCFFFFLPIHFLKWKTNTRDVNNTKVVLFTH